MIEGITMRSQKKLYYFILLFSTSCCISVVHGQTVDIFKSFSVIKQRINSNCYDCAGGTEAGLRSAVYDLEVLVESGFSSVEANRLLSDSYRQIALTYSENNSSEQKELLDRHRKIYQDLIANNPNSLDILLAYARFAENNEAAEILRTKAIEVLAEANFISGAWLEQSTDESSQLKSLDRLQKAFELAIGPNKINYGRRLANYFSRIGQQDKSESVLVEVEAYREKIGL